MFDEIHALQPVIPPNRGRLYLLFTSVALAVALATSLIVVVPPEAHATEVTVPADWPHIPDGVGSGESFRLMFSSSPVTSNDLNISAYNTLIRADAGSNPYIPDHIANGYAALVATVNHPNIRDNTGTNGAGVPIYWMEGSKVADDYNDFYDGSWDNPRDVRTSTGKGQNFGDVGFHYHGTGTFYRGNGAQIGGLTLDDVCDDVGRRYLCEGGEGIGIVCTGHGDTQPGCSSTRRLGQDLITCSVTRDYGFDRRECGPLQDRTAIFGLSPVLTVDDPAAQSTAPTPTLTLAADVASVSEGGRATFTITADPVPYNDVTVNVGTEQEMGEGLDYIGSGTTQQVTIPAGQATATWTVTAYNDDQHRTDGRIQAHIKPGDGYTLGDPFNISLDLLDNDPPTPALQPPSVPQPTAALQPQPQSVLQPQPAPTRAPDPAPTQAPAPQPQPAPQPTPVPVLEPVVLSVSDAQATEGRTLDFVITLNRAARTPVEITYSTLRGEATDDDYTHTVGTITINAGETRRTVHIRTTADDINEQPERMILYLVSVDGAQPDRRSATGTINNN